MSSTLRHLLATITATTADGLTAHLQVEFTREAAPRETAPETTDAMAMDTVENALRQYLADLHAAELPVAGEPLRWLQEKLVAHVVIANAYVVASDLEVSHELRRQMTTGSAPERWTSTP